MWPERWAGTWKDLSANVNLMASNLTDQVRNIAEVTTAVTKGDLTRSIQVEALGEVSDLNDLINEMIRNLRETTHGLAGLGRRNHGFDRWHCEGCGRDFP